MTSHRRSLLGWLLLVLSMVGCAEEARPRNAVLVILDTLRQDRLSLYGGERSSSPAIAALAARGVVFEQAVSSSTWTLSAVSGILAGRYVSAEVMDGRLKQSLVEVLRDAGWQTAAFTEGGYFSRNFGMHLGFERFRQIRRSDVAEGEEIADTFAAAFDWLESREPGPPFFLVVHSYEPHMPYLRRAYAQGTAAGGLLDGRYGSFMLMAMIGGGYEATDEVLAYIRALYDGGVLESDRYVGQLVDRLEALGLADDTLIVVTSDHGEDLGDRDPPRPGTHGRKLYDEQALVPLVIADPTRSYPLARVSAQVRSIDVMPTVLDLLGVPLPSGRAAEDGPSLFGRSLAPVMAGDERADRSAFVRVQLEVEPDPVELLALRSEGWKLIETPGEGGAADAMLFDLAQDPGERQDARARAPDRYAKLKRELEAIRSRLEAEGRPDLTLRLDAPPELREQLRELGYLE
jgi:arylsulfatase A-like enzyme